MEPPFPASPPLLPAAPAGSSPCLHPHPAADCSPPPPPSNAPPPDIPTNIAAAVSAREPSDCPEPIEADPPSLLQPAVPAVHLPPLPQAQQPAAPVELLPHQPAVPAVADHHPQVNGVLIQATAVFESCPNDQLCQDDVESLRKFLLSENHLRSNIVNISLGQVSTRSFRTSFTHTLEGTLEVATSQLWEPAQSCISKHLGKSEWKRSNGTLIII